MRISSKAELARLNFSDYLVNSITYSSEMKSIVFRVSGACFLANGRRKDVGKGYFKVNGYDNIRITSYDDIKKKEIIVDIAQVEPLAEVCEIDIEATKIIVKGFSKDTYQWLEFHIYGGVIEGEFKSE